MSGDLPHRARALRQPSFVVAGLVPAIHAAWMPGPPLRREKGALSGGPKGRLFALYPARNGEKPEKADQQKASQFD